jgi:hypothetical protein
MNVTFNHPLVIFVVSFLVLWLSQRLGSSLLSRRRGLEEEHREHFGVIMGTTLTLLVLLIGFSFSMAISRYDQRKNYEDAEADAIATEFVRTGLLPPGDAASVRSLLGTYLDLRIAFYLARDEVELRAINARTEQLQRQLWSAVQTPANAAPNPVTALAVSGMNDVLNSQAHTQAAWWNRIPHAAWGLMGLIAICCNLLVGYGARNTQRGKILLLILPLVVSIAFLLIADIDSPRGGLIHVSPQNLRSLAESLRAAQRSP